MYISANVELCKNKRPHSQTEYIWHAMELRVFVNFLQAIIMFNFSYSMVADNL